MFALLGVVFFGLFKSLVRSGVLNKQKNGLNKNENKKEPRKVNLYTNKWHARTTPHLRERNDLKTEQTDDKT